MANNNNVKNQSAPNPYYPKITTNFKSNWIIVGADADMIKFAEEAGRALADYDYVASNPQKNRARDKYKLTTSQIRNVYSEIKRIQARSYDKEKNSFFLLKPKVAYATARATSSKGYGMDMFKGIFDQAFQYVKDSETYDNFCNLMEAVLAYHRFYGGK